MNWHRLGKHAIIIILACLQLFYIATIIQEQSSWNVRIGFIVLSLGLLVMYGIHLVEQHSKEYESIFASLWIIIGAVLCYSLNHYFNWGGVLAAGTIGFIGSFIPSIKKGNAYLQKLPPAIYCGCFIGMCGLNVAHTLSFILSAGFVATLIYILSKTILVGVGGKLGTIAFAGVAITYFIVHYFQLTL